MTLSENKPRLAMVLGDPAGIGPELIARLLSDTQVRTQAYIVLIANKDEAEHGMSIAQQRFPYKIINSLENIEQNWQDDHTVLLFDVKAATPFERSVATPEGGKYSLDTLKLALDLTKEKITDGILFGPLNKSSLHLSGMTQNDELHWFADQLNYSGPICEFNTMDDLWTTRATSHVSLAEVPKLITIPRVIEAVSLMYGVLSQSGLKSPRVAVCGLNPHNGDQGTFGREELDVIAPALEKAKAMGMPTDGPFPADTIFLKVFGDKPEYDGVVTMYHDQGQIAIKLMGFSKGVTVQGGLPVPISTPAHGTAFDISGQGKANVGATLQAFNVLMKLATNRRASR